MNIEEHPTIYSYSTNEETYEGSFNSIEEACQEAAAVVGVGGTFWVGENAKPTQPETLWDAEDWLEHVSCQDEYCGDWADGWDASTKEQQEELESEVRKVMAAWLDRHDLRPAFWTAGNAIEFTVASKNGDLYELERP